MISKAKLKTISCTLVLVACAMSILGFQGANTFPIRRSGAVVAGNCTKWVDARTVADAGTACGSGATSVTAAGTLANNSVVTGAGAKAVQDSGVLISALGLIANRIDQNNGATTLAQFFSAISDEGAGVATLLAGASSGTGGPAGTVSPTITGTMGLGGVGLGNGAQSWLGTTSGTNACTVAATGGAVSCTAAWGASKFNTSGNCSSSASPAVCSSFASGSVVVAAAATTVQVNASPVTANSQILLTFDSSLGTKLSVTCNTTFVNAFVTARTANTNFTITVSTAPTTNPACFSYEIIN